MRRVHWLAAACAVGVLAISSAAGAQTYPPEGYPPPTTSTVPVPPPSLRQPLAFSERPLTLPALSAAGNIDLFYFKIQDVGPIEFDPLVGLTIGGEFGITDDLTVGATVLPLLLSPDFEYGNPSLFGLFRFLRGDVEIGAGVEAVIPVQDDTDFALEFSVPVLIRAGRQVRIDTGLNIGLVFADPDMVGSAFVPLQVSFNATQTIFLALQTGIGWPNTAENFGDFMFIPLGVGGFYTVGGPQGPMLDIGPTFSWPGFLTPGSDGDTVNAETFVLGLSARGFLYL